MRRVLATFGLILPFVGALALAAAPAHATTQTGSTHHKSTKTHHASTHKSKSHKKTTTSAG